MSKILKKISKNKHLVMNYYKLYHTGTITIFDQITINLRFKTAITKSVTSIIANTNQITCSTKAIHQTNHNTTPCH